MYINILNSILKYIKFEFLIIMLINAFLVPLHTLKMAINPSDKRNITAITAKYRIRSNVVEILAHMLGIRISVNKAETFPLTVENISGKILLRFNCQIPIINIEQLIRIIDSKLKFPENYTRYMLKTIDRTSTPPTSEFITESCMVTVSHVNQRYTPRRAGPFRNMRVHSAARGPIPQHAGPFRGARAHSAARGSIPRRAGPFHNMRVHSAARGSITANKCRIVSRNMRVHYCKKMQNHIPQHADPLLQKKCRIISRNMRKYLCTHQARFVR